MAVLLAGFSSMLSSPLAYPVTVRNILTAVSPPVREDALLSTAPSFLFTDFMETAETPPGSAPGVKRSEKLPEPSAPFPLERPYTPLLKVTST